MSVFQCINYTLRITSSSVYAADLKRPHTRLFCDGEVECGRYGGTIGIDCWDFQLIVWAKSQVFEGNRVSIRWHLQFLPLSLFFILVKDSRATKGLNQGKWVDGDKHKDRLMLSLTCLYRTLNCNTGLPPSTVCLRGTEKVLLSIFISSEDRTGLSGSPVGTTQEKHEEFITIFKTWSLHFTDLLKLACQVSLAKNCENFTFWGWMTVDYIMWWTARVNIRRRKKMTWKRKSNDGR